MTLQQVLYALTIQECGSMNKAAEKLYIVQPTLTAAIQELESEMGITIFMRTNKGVIVTPEGEEFLEDIRGKSTVVRAIIRESLVFRLNITHLR